MSVKRCPGCGVTPGRWHIGGSFPRIGVGVLNPLCPVEQRADDVRMTLVAMGCTFNMHAPWIWDPDEQGEFASECVERIGVK